MSYTIHHGDCLEVMRSMPDNSVDAIITDPPYFKVKDSAWDNQWKKPHEFVAWMGLLCKQWQRILKPNGSLYVFASPKMAWHVEGSVLERFAVLMRVTWNKGNPGRGAQSEKEAMRNWWPMSEQIIFAEHYGADNIAKGEAGYAAKCDELRGFVFEPLRAYLAHERDRAGWTTQRVNDAWMQMRGTKGQMAGHWFERVQWALPTAKNYAWLRDLFNRSGGDYLRREYEDLRREYEDLRREYEDLRREYEDLRRPFTVTADDQYTDVWTFPTVQAYKGKHECEKPLPLMEHIVKASTRPGAVVLDPFMGSGSTGHACLLHGRQFIGIEMQAKWCEFAERRLSAVARQGQAQPRSIAQAVTAMNPRQVTLFDAIGDAA